MFFTISRRVRRFNIDSLIQIFDFWRVGLRWDIFPEKLWLNRTVPYLISPLYGTYPTFMIRYLGEIGTATSSTFRTWIVKHSFPRSTSVFFIVSFLYTSIPLIHFHFRINSFLNIPMYRKHALNRHIVKIYWCLNYRSYLYWSINAKIQFLTWAVVRYFFFCTLIIT